MIYFLQETGPFRNRIKIGYSEDMATLKKRISLIQTGSPSKLIILFMLPGSKSDETIMHERFSQYRLHREWFRYGLFLRIFVLANRHKFYSPDDLEQVYQTVDDTDVTIVDESDFAILPKPEPTEHETKVLDALEETEKLDKPSWNKLQHVITGRNVHINSNQKIKYENIFKKYDIKPSF